MVGGGTLMEAGEWQLDKRAKERDGGLGGSTRGGTGGGGDLDL